MWLYICLWIIWIIFAPLFSCAIYSLYKDEVKTGVKMKLSNSGVIALILIPVSFILLVGYGINQLFL